ncbi:MAG TPA: type II toxin-antitoxin system VapC family toxin [Allosphingosinicella sp.]|nr:type II toxin-antitoxin system VapC family toxin [Allosphingosinicella sp.]
MSEHVLDASALLAVMLEEPGAEKVRELLPGAIVGAVNLAEVVAKLQERGAPDENIDRNIARLDLPVIPFDAAQAMAAGKLRARTRSLGLSLGDRACLALAIERGLPAVTTDRGWAALDIGAEVIVARE